MITKSKPDKRKGLASVFSVWINKRIKDGKRQFQSEQDMLTAVYIANRQGAVKYANLEAHVEPEKR